MDISLTTTKVRHFLFLLIFLTSSYDIAANLVIGGFSFRSVYIFVLILTIFLVKEVIKKSYINLQFLGLFPFLLWSFLLTVFIPNTPLIGRNIGYMLWLFIHFVFIFISTYFIKNELSVNALVRLYLLSFILNSLLGLIQFVLGIVGYDLLIAQWWIQDQLPRLNGFSYEPSYYSTYLIIGFSTAYYLYRKNVNTFGRLPKYTFILTFVAIILSTSRMGIMIAVLQIICFELFLNRKNIRHTIIFVAVASSILIGVFYIFLLNENLLFLLSGLGIMGTSAHSSVERLDGFITQLEIFSRSPFRGYSLGGVSQVIAFEKGVTVFSQETIKPYDISINIFVEALTASGLIGFIFFLSYMYCLTFRPMKSIANLDETDEKALLMKAFVWGLLIELAILCFNQNILRAYLWIHIAVLNSIYFYMKRYCKEKIHSKYVNI